jgi:SAM-dependent methyltransferase
MGLAYYMLEGVIREHCHRAIIGSVVQIGRQTMELTVPQMRKLFDNYGLSLGNVRDEEIEIDRQTTQVRQTGAPYVSDHALFTALGAAEVHAVDHSDFEGADIIHDMNRPIDPALDAIADLILDGSTLDNVHDPAIALMNYNRMLRPGGRVVSINVAKPDVVGAYTGMAPEWFLDYYAINEYSDCRIYAQLNFPAVQWSTPTEPAALLAMDYTWTIENGRAPALYHQGWTGAIVFAEKGTASTWDTIPHRAQFRTADEQARWLAAVKRFSTSDRPSHLQTMRPEFVSPDGFVTAQFSETKALRPFLALAGSTN